MTPQIFRANMIDAAVAEKSPLGQTDYAFSRQKLNEIIKMLRDCDIEEIIKLPKIAVIGNQSAGKSSVLEAISQIKVPRASGTCTRCPMEVNLRSSEEPWRGKVSLRFAADDPRVKTSSVIPFNETTSKDEITKILRQAQLAILNPSKPLTDFTELNETECDNYNTALKFSRSTVVLEITGADVDVTLVDLPGIISNTDDVCSLEASNDLRLMTKLILLGNSRFQMFRRNNVLSSLLSAWKVQTSNSPLQITLLIIPDDIDNQSAVKIAKEKDPNGVRTIGVFLIQTN